MGTSTDAILVYGIPISEEWENDFEEGVTPEEGFGYLLFSGESNSKITGVLHCSDAHPKYLLAIAGTETTARRGHPVRVKPRSMKIRKGWNNKLRAYALAHDLPTEGEPGWYLCSYWG